MLAIRKLNDFSKRARLEKSKFWHKLAIRKLNDFSKRARLEKSTITKFVKL